MKRRSILLVFVAISGAIFIYSRNERNPPGSVQPSKPIKSASPDLIAKNLGKTDPVLRFSDLDVIVSELDNLINIELTEASSAKIIELFNLVLQKRSYKQAIALLERIPLGICYDQCSAELAKALALNNLQLGKDWLSGLEQIPRNTHAFGVFATEWAKTDIASTLEFGRKISAPETRKKYYKCAFMGAAITDIDTAFNLLKTEPDITRLFEKSPSRLVQDLVNAAASQGNFQKAVEGLALLPEKDSDWKMQHQLLIMQWAPKKPTECLDWALAIKDSMRSEFATKEVIKSWVHIDSIKASQWINEQPTGGVKDLAIAELVNGIYVAEPADALKWAASITSKDERLTSAKKVFMRLSETAGVDVATDAVSQLKLTNEEKVLITEK